MSHFQRLLLEELQEDSELERVLSPWRKRDFSLHVTENKEHIKVDTLVVPFHLRGQGHGTKVMEAIHSYADKKGLPVHLTPELGLGATSKARLTDFYRDLGYVPNAGKNKDWSSRATMIRLPKSNK